MMQTASRLGRAAIPVVSAGVAATVNAGPAHADASSRGELPFQIADQWEFADIDDQRVLFTPEAIDDAVNMFKRPLQPPAIEQGDSSELSSDGTVDEIIECSSFTGGLQAAGGSSTLIGVDSGHLLTVAGRLLKKPGVQRELLSAALSDPEVFDILLGKMDQPGYLEAQGFAARGLLPAPGSSQAAAGPASGAAAHSTSTTQACSEDEEEGNLLDDMAVWAADCVEGVGFRVLALARWMRGKLTGLEAGSSAASASSSRASSAAGTRGRAAGGSGNLLHRVVGGGALALVTAMVAVIAVALLKQPALLRRVAASASRRL